MEVAVEQVADEEAGEAAGGDGEGELEHGLGLDEVAERSGWFGFGIVGHCLIIIACSGEEMDADRTDNGG